MQKKLPAISLLLASMLCGNRLFAQNNALAFNGTNNYVAVGAPLASGSSYTKEAWVYVNGAGANNIASSQNHPFWVDDNKLKAGNGGNYAIVQDPGTISYGVWVHAAVTYDAVSGTMKLYKNGSLISTATAPAYTSEPITLGAHYAASSAFLNGRLDEVRIWNRVLCQDEIQNNMSGTLPNPASQPGLVRYYQINQGTAGGANTGITQLSDASITSVNGTLSGFSLANGNTTSNFIASTVAGSAAGAFNAPEVNVTGNGVNIPDGQTAYSAANYTEFTAGVTSRSFTIQNTGSASLSITGTSITGTNSAEFSLSVPPAGTVTAGGSTSITVSFAPTGSGLRTAVLHIANTDCDEADYDFVLTGTAAGGALDFDGVDDYASTTLLLTPSYTKEAWIKLPSANTALGNYNIVSGQMTTGAHAFWVSDDYGGYKLAAGHNGTFNYVIEAVDFPRNVWTHVAVTYDAATTTMRLYKDGVLVNSNTTVPALSGASNYINIGNFIDQAQFNGFLGQMDEVRVWNRALCQAEIQSNRSSMLFNPAGQNGLLLYYSFNQGAAGTSNTGISAITDAGPSGINATLNGFGRTGTSSNFVYSSVATTTGTAFSPAPSTGSGNSTQNVAGSTQFNNSCAALTSITPSGAAPVSGAVTTKVTVDNSVQTYAGNAYVQRHYDIEPASNANTATATITLYFTQAEFTAYNAANGSDPDLPADAADVANNKANLRITQFHGTSATSLPGSYTGWAGSGPAIIVITPSVTWNGTASRWEAVIPVTGFSGFYAAGLGLSGGIPLPVQLISFTAEKAVEGNIVKWSVGKEETGTVYSLEHSADGRSFVDMVAVTAAGRSQYGFTDAQPFGGNNYYRLRIAENGKTSYSGTVLLRGAGQTGTVTVTPVPATSSIRVVSTDPASLNQPAVVTDMAGRMVHRFVMAADQQIDIQRWPAGVYSLKTGNGQVVRVVKQ